MPDSLTAHRSYVKPEDGASMDTWGVKLNNDLDAIDGDIYALLTNGRFGVNTGTANALAITPAIAITGYVAGYKVAVQVTADNTTAVTLAVSGLAAQAIKTNDGAALIAGVLKAGGIYRFVHDGTDFLLAERPSATADDLAAGTDAYRVATPSGMAGLITVSGGVVVEKKPGGYMEMSGSYTGGASNPTITFPIAFTSPPNIQLTAVSTNSDTNAASKSVHLASLGVKATDHFTAFCSMEDETTDVMISSTNTSFDWVARGK